MNSRTCAGQLVALTVISALSGAAGAVGNLMDVTVLDRAEGRPLQVYQHEGQFFVVGRPGNEYQVRVRNRLGADALAVMSVDGVNVVSGETANWNQTGYVLGAGQAFDVKGWRKSTERTAAFFFTQLDSSYAARTGRPDHVGVIGVAVFRKRAEPEVRIEQPRPRREAPRDLPYEPPYPASGDAQGSTVPPATAMNQAEDAIGARGRSEAASAGARMQPPMAERSAPIGTGHGRTETSRVSYTSFMRATAAPEEVITIRYDTYANLVAMGVIRAPRIAQPSPFPGQFVPDPR